jgi:hypothetical protein
MFPFFGVNSLKPTVHRPGDDPRKECVTIQRENILPSKITD